MLRPRLLDLLSRRWYSMGDCRAEKHRRGTLILVLSTYKLQVLNITLGSSPFRKLRWDSRICTTSLTQALQVSVDEACNWKRTTLPSGLRDVITKRASSPSTPGSTPRQLTWNTAHLTSVSVAFGPPSGS